MRRLVVVVMQRIYSLPVMGKSRGVRRTSLFALVLVHQKLVLRLVLRLPSPLLLVLMLLRRRDTLAASRL
jgi:hypothetical protein